MGPKCRRVRNGTGRGDDGFRVVEPRPEDDELRSVRERDFKVVEEVAACETVGPTGELGGRQSWTPPTGSESFLLKADSSATQRADLSEAARVFNKGRGGPSRLRPMIPLNPPRVESEALITPRVCGLKRDHAPKAETSREVGRTTDWAEEGSGKQGQGLSAAGRRATGTSLKKGPPGPEATSRSRTLAGREARGPARQRFRSTRSVLIETRQGRPRGLDLRIGAPDIRSSQC